MTRINCVPVEELHSKHLVAEYRELPRVFKLAEAYAVKHGQPPADAPTVYTLGKGHVKFFYTHLGYCQLRFLQLVKEMELRGYSPQFRTVQEYLVPLSWRSEWTPTTEALSLNRERIKQRMPK